MVGEDYVCKDDETIDGITIADFVIITTPNSIAEMRDLSLNALTSVFLTEDNALEYMTSHITLCASCKAHYETFRKAWKDQMSQLNESLERLFNTVGMDYYHLRANKKIN